MDSKISEAARIACQTKSPSDWARWAALSSRQRGSRPSAVSEGLICRTWRLLFRRSQEALYPLRVGFTPDCLCGVEFYRGNLDVSIEEKQRAQVRCRHPRPGPKLHPSLTRDAFLLIAKETQ